MNDTRVRVLIVDDEPLARRGVRLHLEKAGGFEIVGEAANGRDAIECIRTLRPDAVFLDVQMPGIDGFGVVDAIGVGQMPVTVFVTAYDAHALRAFEAHAIDYVLKPIDPARFADAAQRVRTIVASGSVPQRLVLRDGARVIVVEPSEIDWIQADGDYVRVYIGGRGYLVRHTIGRMEERLDASRFQRIHRSTIVNVARVREVTPDGDRRYRVLLRDGTSLTMSRGFRERLAALLGRD
jgi:two-component system LytT family response regulator